jgi:hypothetical protein
VKTIKIGDLKMAGHMKSTHQGFNSVMEEHREEIDEHMTALANIFQRAGAGDRIDTMTLKPYTESDLIEIVWDRTETVNGTVE